LRFVSPTWRRTTGAPRVTKLACRETGLLIQ
jgi:hypothetical protein